jgi:5-dehydro-4-deoxyglucarate dehydratase
MEPQELKQRLRGVLAFTPTPFTDDDRVDFDGLARQVDFLCNAGVQASGGRVPVLAGIGHSTTLACRLASYAESVGAAGLMINPLYFVTPSPEGFFRHYQTLSQATGLGMIVFSTTGAVYTPPMLERLAEVETVIALKDEYGDLNLFIQSVERLGDRLVWINGMAEPLVAPYVAAGAQAMTSGLVNFAPQLTISIWQAGVEGRWNELHDLVARKVRPLARLRARRPGYHIAVIKEAMNLLGLPGGNVRSPLVPLAPEDRDELRRILKDLELL